MTAGWIATAGVVVTVIVSEFYRQRRRAYWRRRSNMSVPTHNAAQAQDPLEPRAYNQGE